MMNRDIGAFTNSVLSLVRRNFPEVDLAARIDFSPEARGGLRPTAQQDGTTPLA